MTHVPPISAATERGVQNAAAVNTIVHRELEEHGVRYNGNASLRAVEGKFGRVALLTLQGDASADLRANTPPHRSDHVAIMFVTAIALRRQPLREVKNRYLVIADSDSVTTMRCMGRWKMTRLLVPHSMMFPHVLSGCNQTHTGHRQLERAVERFIDTLLETSSGVTSLEQHATEPLLIEMSRALLLDRIQPDMLSSRRGLLTRATALMQQQCGDPGLTPTCIARDTGTSLRQLQVAFADAGTTVAEELRRERALKARAMLTDQRFAAFSIDQIRERSGFQTSMSFRRALLMIFESTPTFEAISRSARSALLRDEPRRPSDLENPRDVTDQAAAAPARS